MRRRVTVAGNRLAHTIEELLQRGDVRRVCILDEEKSILEIPFTVGDPAAPATILKAPILAAIRAFGALVNECTVDVETADSKKKSKEPRSV